MEYDWGKSHNEIVPALKEDIEMENEIAAALIAMNTKCIEDYIEMDYYPEKSCSRKIEAARNCFWALESQ